MQSRLLVGLLACLFWGGGLTAQRATQVTDFNLETSDNPFLYQIYAADGRLFGALSNSWSVEGSGILSEIDPATGQPTSVLPDDYYYINQPRYADNNGVVEVGDALLGVVTTTQFGSQIVRLREGREPEQIFDGLTNYVTRPVPTEDGLAYFLAGNQPRNPAPGNAREVEVDVYRTDGTPAGTRRLGSLPQEFSPGGIQLTVGRQRLLIDVDVDGDHTLWTFDLTTGEAEAVTYQGDVFTVNPPSFGVNQPRSIYHDGALYFIGAINNLDSSTPALIRIDDRTGTTEIAEFANPTSPFGGLYVAGGTLYLSVNELDDSPPDFYRATYAGTPGSLQLDRVTAPNDTEEKEFLVSCLVVADDLSYYVTSSGRGGATLRSLDFTTGTLTEVATLPDVQSFFSIVSSSILVTGRYAYLGGGVLPAVYRVELATGTVSTFKSPLLAPSNQTRLGARDGRFLSVDGSVYFRADAEKRALYAWRSDQAAPEPIGPFLTRIFPVSFPLGTFSSRTEVGALVVGTPAGNYSYDRNLETFSATPLTEGSLRIRQSLLSHPEYQLFTGAVNGMSDQVIRLNAEGNLVTVPIASEIPHNPNNYQLFISGIQLGEVRAVSLLADRTTGFSRRLFATFDGDSLRLTEVNPVLSAVGLPDRAVIEGDYATFRVDGSLEVFRLSDGESLYSQTLGQADEPLLAVDSNGIFTYRVDRPADEAAIVFYSAAGEATVMNTGGGPDLGQFAFFGYLLDGRFVFVTDSRAFGRELAVADPSTGTIEVLRDFAPGQAGGFSWFAPPNPGSSHVTFTAYTPETGLEFWRTDGTPTGTTLVDDLSPGPASSSPNAFASYKDGVFFRATGPDGIEPYYLDLIDPGATPVQITDLNPGPGGSIPGKFVVLGDDLFFTGRDSDESPFEIYRVSLQRATSTRTPTQVLLAHVYPNPVGHGRLRVEAPGGERLLRLDLYDAQGRPVLTGAGGGARATDLDMSTLPNGTYWLRTQYASGKTSINMIQRAD